MHLFAPCEQIIYSAKQTIDQAKQMIDAIKNVQSIQMIQTNGQTETSIHTFESNESNTKNSNELAKHLNHFLIH